MIEKDEPKVDDIQERGKSIMTEDELVGQLGLGHDGKPSMVDGARENQNTVDNKAR